MLLFCQILLVFAVNLQMLLTGYGIGFSAPCLSQVLDYIQMQSFSFWQQKFLQLTNEEILTADELGWFPGSLVLGQLLGILLGPLLADLVFTIFKKSPCKPSDALFCKIGSNSPPTGKVKKSSTFVFFYILVLCWMCRWAEDSLAYLRPSPPLPPGSFSQPGSPGLLLLLLPQIFLIMFSTSQLGWTLLLGRTLTGLTDSLVT